MFTNYLKIGMRSFLRRKAFSLINVLGLAVGMACCILVVLYVRHEVNFDTFFPNAKGVYRIALERKYPGRMTKYAIIPHSLGLAAVREIPEIQEMTRLFGGFGDTPFLYQNKTFNERNVIAADSTMFRVLALPFVLGDAKNALQKPNSIIMTESTAKRYFGSDNPLGKILRFPGAGAGNPGDLIVTGVCKDIPEQSHLKADIIVAVTTFPFIRRDNYVSFSAYTYVALKEGANPKTVEQKLVPIVEKYAGGEIERELGVKYKDYQAAGNGYNYFLQPLTDIHLHSQLEGEIRPNGNSMYVYVLSCIAVFIMLIAAINFMNLATARSVERAREVGIRKTFGSLRQQLAAQFLVESLIMSAIALVLAIVFVEIALPVFNSLTGKQLALAVFSDAWIVPLLLVFAIVVGVLAGGYPALVLSSFEPVAVLKGKFRTSSRGIWLRNGLVIFQFAISVVLIACTIVVYNQLEFVQKKNLGFTKDWTIVVKNIGALENRFQTFKQEAQRINGVVGASGVSTIPSGFFFGFSCVAEGSKEVLVAKAMFADDDALGVMGMKLNAGRGFAREFQDSASIILNATAVRKFNLTNPIGKHLVSSGLAGNVLPDGTPPVTFTIVGVVEDFHFQSLHDEISPLVMLSSDFSAPVSNMLTVRVKPESAQSVMAELERLWKNLGALQPFTATFLDKELAEKYTAEETAGRIFAVFAGIAIFIACMGLLGLAAYTTSQRTKEIGIRKVLGASVISIIGLLSKDFLKLVVLAICIATPLAYWVSSKWLQDFAYRIDLGFWIFIVAGTSALMIALLTVSYQALRSAQSNPIHALRSE